MIVAMATVLSTIFLFDMYALIKSIASRMKYNVLYQSYDFLKTCTLALIINSPVKGLKVDIKLVTFIIQLQNLICAYNSLS